MMKEEINLIGRFDESKVSVQESDPMFGTSTIWYDITEDVKKLINDKTLSILEYVVKIEAEICYHYHEDEDYLSQAKEEYEDIINAEYRLLGCFQEERGLRIQNDARKIRLTFNNGSVIDISNSEWGSILIS